MQSLTWEFESKDRAEALTFYLRFTEQGHQAVFVEVLIKSE